MKSNWKDIEEYPGNWNGLLLNVETDNRPGFHLESGDNARIKLMNQNSVVFWATIESRYYGVWLLKSLNEKVQLDLFPIPPISSETITKSEKLIKDRKYRFWCKFFADELLKSKSTFLYSGLWLFRPIRIQETSCQNEIQDDAIFERFFISNYKNMLNQKEIYWIDWWLIGGKDLISTKPQPNLQMGRLKWWRKIAKEQKLPPILIWYLNCLDAFIIIDGHLRLTAALLENIVPDFILAYSVNSEVIVKDKKRQDKIVNSMTNRLKMKSMSVDKINSILIEAFDERAHLKAVTVSQALPNMEVEWEKEIKEMLVKINKEDMERAFINREK